MLGLDLPNGAKLGRFRDAWVNEDGTKIIVFTRNGGGNRECWELDGCKGDQHDPDCMVTVINGLRKHPNYAMDYDDDFDSTYAYFEFTVPEKFKDFVKALATGEKEKSLLEKTNEVLEEMKKMTPEQLKQDARFKPLAEVLQKIIAVKEKEEGE